MELLTLVEYAQENFGALTPAPPDHNDFELATGSAVAQLDTQARPPVPAWVGSSDA
jgi:hypothetical protein